MEDNLFTQVGVRSRDSGNRDRARSAGNIIIALTVKERPKWAEGLI